MAANDFDPRLTPARPDLAAASLRGRVDAERFVDGVPHRVVWGRAPVRSAPHVDAGLMTELLYGAAVTVFDEAEGFAWTQAAADGYVGYIPAAALEPGPQRPSHRFTARQGHLYPKPDIKHPPRIRVYFGARLCTRPGDHPPGFLALADGDFVPVQHVAPVAALADEPAAVAEWFLGAPYLWGGGSAEGLDCSALIQIAFDACGRAVPRDSDLQWQALSRTGRAVAPASAARGDVAFFPGHVGILVAPGRLLHANATHMAVTVDPLDDVVAWLARDHAEPLTGIVRP
ncbi:hypothetical protein CCR80_13095 [Rhodothalassium salexigens]|uniref:C40 family peptidase n=1 Tax=Rhodothalassium salexigens TaxID=1086 RepID=UPI0019113505|nr:NlpC/P60 family protein [Rhodothalassium salexigens]MBK5921970.1 hypothetical protein [Rhodothalassium salexigens]